MRFFSKITCICNICFLITIPLRMMDMAHKQTGNLNGVTKLPMWEETIVVLGYSALFVNLFFFFSVSYWIFNGKIKLLPKWIVLFNLVLFPIQLIYFFILP